MRTMTVKQYLAIPEAERPPVFYSGEPVSLVYRDPSYQDRELYVIRLPMYGAGSKRGDTLLHYADAPGEFSVVLADPPWPYEFSNTRASDTPDDYPRLSVDAIMRLRPPASDNCALFLWARGPLLQEALDVIQGWGFVYRTIAWTWVKLNPNGQGYWPGMGAIRSNAEPCLLAVRGRMPVKAHDVSALIIAPIGYDHESGKQVHSRKPDEQYAKIERLYPGESYLEMFARRRRAGWAAHGNEIEGGVIIEPREPYARAGRDSDSLDTPGWEGTEDE